MLRLQVLWHYRFIITHRYQFLCIITTSTETDYVEFATCNTLSFHRRHSLKYDDDNGDDDDNIIIIIIIIAAYSFVIMNWHQDEI